jgi:SSS family solute:Na+ symporter
MAVADWMMVAVYLAATMALGLWFTRKAGTSTTDYFVAGRSLSWFVAGTSILATTFSSDTPLVVAGISRQSGFSGHWFWLPAAIGQTATVFFFARLWRRAEVMTDVQFVAARYEPSTATSALRIFRVFFDGVLVNGIVMASVTRAMVKIVEAVLDLPQEPLCRLPVLGDIDATALILVVLAGVAVLYSAFSGLYGVVYTDVVQFALAMVGSIALAAIVYGKACEGPGMMARLASSSGFDASFLSFFPDFGSSSFLAIFTFFVYISMIWWYRVPGNGYSVQRLLATRSERDSFFAFLWFNVCQYVLRPWPWILVGLLSLHYLPDLPDPESSFPKMIGLFLPVGLKGIMVASLFAAFMSTIDTHLNWGSSYIINDLYQPFIRPGRSPKHYVFVSRLAMLLLTVLALLLTTRLTSVLGAYKYLATMFGGTGTVMIARWYWWRINPYSEIAAIVASLVVANALEFIVPDAPGADLLSVRLVLTISIVTFVWVLVTFLTSTKTPRPHAIAFYSKMRIPGPGWKKVREMAGVGAEPGEFLRSLIAWLCCTVFIFSAMLGLGKFLFHAWFAGLVYTGVAILTGLALYRQISQIRFL